MFFRFLFTSLIILSALSPAFAQLELAEFNIAYLTYQGNQVTICINDEYCGTNPKHFNRKAINKVIFSGDQGNLQKQMGNVLKFLKQKKNKRLRIRIVEIANFPELDSINSLIQEFDHLSVLIINNCPKLGLVPVVRMINQINGQFHSPPDESLSNKKKLKHFKKKFKERPSIYYLNTLVLQGQNLQKLPKPEDLNLRIFNYLEELKIVAPTDSLGARDFVESLIDDYLVRDTSMPYYSIFPNVKFITFKDCYLSDLPEKLKYRREFVSIDLSGNYFKKIPTCLREIETRALLSVNFSDNYLEELDSLFLDNFCLNAPDNDRFSRYFFLDDNCLSKEELEKLKYYQNRFNTLSFNDNCLIRSEMIELARVLESGGKRIAQFMTGAPRYVNDYKPNILRDFPNPKCQIEKQEKVYPVE